LNDVTFPYGFLRFEDNGKLWQLPVPLLNLEHKYNEKKITDDAKQAGEDLEGSDRALIEVQLQHVPGGA
jgi:hypothetical protein